MSHTLEEFFDVFDELEDEPDCEEQHAEPSECPHLTLVNEAGAILCRDCGHERSKVMSYEKDWRYYGSDDTRKSSDPTRCHIRKMEDKSIYKDVEAYGFSEKIVSTANDIYFQVTKGKIYRGNSRKAIIFGCIFHAIKMTGKSYTCDHLREIFKLDRKIILKGLKHVNLNAPKDSQLRVKNSSDIVEECMDKFDLTEEDKSEIRDLYQSIRNRSSVINRSRPQSVTSSLVYYYICRKRGFNNVNLKDFVKKVKLSELTIHKLSREIQSIVT